MVSEPSSEESIEIEISQKPLPEVRKVTIKGPYWPKSMEDSYQFVADRYPAPEEVKGLEDEEEKGQE